MLRSGMKDTVPPAATLRRWTRAEYDRLIELGVFENGERLELIDGFLVVREPQGARHATGIRRVVAALRRALGSDWQIDSQLPLALDPASEPEPDVSVVPGDAGTYRDAHPSRPLLVVEVADSAYRIDHDFKTSLYARAAVPECWIIDVVRSVIEIHRDPARNDSAPTAGATHTSNRSILPRRSHPCSPRTRRSPSPISCRRIRRT